MQYTHIHVIQAYPYNTYNTERFIQYNEIHTIHTHTYVYVCTCMCLYWLYLVCICINMYVYAYIGMYKRVCVCINLYVHVSVCICMYFIFCFAQDAKGKRWHRPGPGSQQCAFKKGINRQQNHLEESGTRTHVYTVICGCMSHWANCGSDTMTSLWVYIPLSKIHTHTDNTYIYIHIHTDICIYMHIQTHTCMCQ